MKTHTKLVRALLPALIIAFSFIQAKATPLSVAVTSQNNVGCYGGGNGQATVTASGGTTPYTYLWTPTGQTYATAVALAAGTYTVSVWDANAATASVTVTITQPSPLIDSILVMSNITCNGGNTGGLQGGATGGTPPYRYLWVPSGETSATATGLTAGCYTLVTTDIGGCSVTASNCITQPNSLILAASVGRQVSCNNGNNGIVIGIVSGGTSPYTYIWNNGGTDDTATGLSAGCYTLAVLDAHGCSGSVTTCITQPSAISITLSSTPDNGSCTGTATASVTGGASPYTYVWYPSGGNNPTASGLCSGTYCCEVWDQNLCMDSSCTYVNLNCANNYDQSICSVTLDTATNKCEVMWGRTNSPPSGGYGHFNIYRDTGAGYSLVNSQPLNVLSEFIDASSYPSLGPVSYELSTVDSCGESALSAPHTSIYLTTAAALNVYILNWTAYVGFTPSKYIIYRGPSLSNLTAIDSVANNVYTYHDTLPPLGSYYVLEAENPNGPCVPTTHQPGKVSLLSGAFSNGFNTGKLLGINNVGNNVSDMKLYPNPSNGLFTLSYSMNGSDNIEISIINELGQAVYTEQKRAANGPVTEQLNMENLAAGIYTLRMQTSKGISVSKLAIMQK